MEKERKGLERDRRDRRDGKGKGQERDGEWPEWLGRAGKGWEAT